MTQTLVGSWPTSLSGTFQTGGYQNLTRSSDLFLCSQHDKRDIDITLLPVCIRALPSYWDSAELDILVAVYDMP